MPTNRVYVVATLGPASTSPKILADLMRSGVRTFRLNLSHGDGRHYVRVIRRVRAVSKRVGKRVRILIDLRGPKIRVERFSKRNGFLLSPGRRFRLLGTPVLGDQYKASLNYPDIIPSLRKGQSVFVNDGKIKLVVVRPGKRSVTLRVEVGGRISDHKGVNIPQLHSRIPVLEEADQNDLRRILTEAVDEVAISFVRSKKDVETVRAFVRRHTSGAVRMISKIEKREAIDRLDSILGVSDGIIVARGDLGIELPIEEMAIHQKRIIRKAHLKKREAIVATEMLDSMTHTTRPTRAETTDVANAVFDGADGLLLSQETAVGKYPALCVRTMSKIISCAESSEFVRK